MPELIRKVFIANDYIVNYRVVKTVTTRREYVEK